MSGLLRHRKLRELSSKQLPHEDFAEGAVHDGSGSMDARMLPLESLL